MSSYLTLAGPAQAEIIIKKSRFIARAVPVQSAGEAAAFVAEVKSAHWDATHNVWAYALREGQLRRYSDDGEPQGTAGLPTLDVLQKQSLVDCAVVVTRYFGGTLLGAGGLVRAYSQAAKEAVEAAGIVTMALCALLRVRCEYGFYGRLQSLVPEAGGVITAVEFAEGVTLDLRIRGEDAPSFLAAVTDASHGCAVCEQLGEEFAQLDFRC